MSPGSGHHPHSEASHRNMAIILTTLTLIIMITRHQSEDRVCHSGPIRGQLTEVAGWYQAESDLANNSRTQTSLAGQNCNHWAEVSALPSVLQLELSSQLLLDRVWMRWECWPVCTSCHGTRDTILSVARVERLVFGAIFWLIMFDHAKSRVMIPAKPGLIDTIASAPLRAQTVSD